MSSFLCKYVTFVLEKYLKRNKNTSYMQNVKLGLTKDILKFLTRNVI